MDRRVKLKSVRQEKREARKFGGRARKGSGCGPNNKGDVETKVFLIECKRTDKKQIVLKKEVIDKIEQEALQHGKEPLIALEIQDRRVYVILENTFDACRGAIEALVKGD